MRIIRRNTLIVGTGAAGLNAADRLWSFGQKDLAVVTEGVHTGTSRNTGSDKQTYYKLSLSGDRTKAAPAAEAKSEAAESFKSTEAETPASEAETEEFSWSTDKGEEEE